MLKPISTELQQKISTLINEMTLEEKVTQVQCINGSHKTKEEIKDLVLNKKIGALFGGNISKEEFKQMSDAAQGAKIPVIICADFVNGAGARMAGATKFPHQMGCAAANSEELIEKMGEITAEEGRAYGVHWTFAPVIDLCLNKQNPMMHVRTFGDDRDRILKMSKAFIKGVQKEGLMAATSKHFPGDGVDSRDTHITTLVNSLSREEWENSYGKIWREAINSGVMAVMGGHIALPFIDSGYEDEKDKYKGPIPATLSKKIQVDFLRKELGFEGLVVSDALNMVGFGSHLQRKDYGWRLIQSGTDMLLWTIPEIDTPSIINGIKDGRITEQQLDYAVRKVLELKARVGLLDDTVYYPTVTKETFAKNQLVAQKVADKSITLIRDALNIIPLKHLKKGSKVLTITSHYIEGQRNKRDSEDLIYVDEELKNRGFIVEHLVNPAGLNFSEEMLSKYDAIFVNIKYPPRYGSIRLYGDSFGLFKGSWWVENPKVVFTSFGDPFKLYDLPSLHNYINAYSNNEVSQRSAVKVWLGEIEPQGKSPINLDEYR